MKSEKEKREERVEGKVWMECIFLSRLIGLLWLRLLLYYI